MTNIAELDAPPREFDLLDSEAERRRIDGNFEIVETALRHISDELKKLQHRRHRPRRTGAAARINADDIRFFWAILALNMLFAAAALTASYAGQYAMAPHTHLPQYLWWLVPLFIEVPLVITSSTILIFRQRGQSTVLPWGIIGALTLVSSTVNVVHVLSESGVLAGSPLTVETTIGATVMGVAPLLILLGWEEIARLAVKPPTRAERAVPAVKTAPNKRKK